ncbi:unnamed protein product [Miscanthus lutarioriparius]|uniref:Uncharacterized protein n=1 Tax=Miscanthus lutarioriparius TaxID=422564 RepID=A0A811QP40_9POAL|nr:unnamed protein product [Miscanthus lutarioriparius]
MCINCGKVGGSSTTHGQVRTYQLPLSTMHEALDTALKPIMKSIGSLQRSVDELKKEKAENEGKEKRLKKNLDDLGDQLASVVQNVHDLQSKLQGAMPPPPANN